jgi:hypothetical protein
MLQDRATENNWGNKKVTNEDMESQISTRNNHEWFHGGPGY